MGMTGFRSPRRLSRRVAGSLLGMTALAACAPADRPFDHPPAAGVTRMDLVLRTGDGWGHPGADGAGLPLEGIARHVAGPDLLDGAAVTCEGDVFSAGRYRTDDRGRCTLAGRTGSLAFVVTVTGHLGIGLRGAGAITGGDGRFAGNAGRVLIGTGRIDGRHVEVITLHADLEWDPLPEPAPEPAPEPVPVTMSVPESDPDPAPARHPAGARGAGDGAG